MEELGNQKNTEETNDIQIAENKEEMTETDISVQQDEANTENEENEEKSSILSDTLEIFETVVISVFVVLLMFAYIARPVTVEGGSMKPTLEDTDKLVMRTIFYTPQIGDIVIVDNNAGYTLDANGNIKEETGLNKRLIKRVIATGGQTIDIDFTTGAVTVDGKVLEEDYIASPTNYDAKSFDYPVTVPEGYVFVMGDNRNNSTDSRDNHVGFVKEEDVLGKAVVRFYPLSKFKLL